MSLENVFTPEFIGRVQALLEENCPVGTGKCMTRTALAEALGVGGCGMEGAIGSIVTNNVIVGWVPRRGPQGGIGRIGERAQKSAQASTFELTDEFKESLRETVDELIDHNGNAVPRAALAAHMGDEKYKAYISLALKLPEFSYLGTKLGKTGGVYRVSSVDEASEDLGDDLVSSMEESLDSQEENLEAEAV